ncbi:uncharacterized protein [Periplaneta americana]|uniref:uncharacterized protein n=1 Tax=Periplaneta americana TaxID=6978 RepID=UPI0037E857D8
MGWFIRLRRCLLLLVALTTLCACLSAGNFTGGGSTKNDVLAIILQKPGEGSGKSIESRKLREIFSWLQPLFNAASQTTGTGTPVAGASNFFNSLFGGGASYAYPFPFRR